METLSTRVMADPWHVPVLRPGRCAAAGTILLATGDSGLAETVRAVLQRADGVCYEVVPACGMGAVEQQLSLGGIDLLLLDLGTGYGSPSGRMQRIAVLAESLPVIVMVAGGDRHSGLSAVSNGAYAYFLRDELGETRLLSTVESAVEHQRMVDRLRRRESRLRLAVDGSGLGLWDWDLARDTAVYSSRWNALLGLPAEDVEDSPRRWFSRVHPDDLRALQRALEVHLNGCREQLEHEHRMRTADGSYRWFAVRGRAVHDSFGRAVRCAGAIRDVTVRRESDEQVLRNAMHDALTGLPNRALFLDRVAAVLARNTRRPARRFAVLFLDLDRFKRVNDTLGHAVGDQLLVAVAERLQTLVRPEDTVARLCGDEFGILLPEVEAQAALQVAERIHCGLEESFNVGGHEITVGASVGIALSGDHGASPRQLLHDADTAMYRAKAGGGGGYQMFDEAMHERACALVRMEAELRTAVMNSDFVMHYQPVMALDTARIVGFEALVRWRHPERGLVTPTQFLAVAEASELVVPIGWWAIDSACRQMALWHRSFAACRAMHISINVSAKLFSQADMVERLQAILDSSGLAPGALLLELAEKVVAAHGADGVVRLQELRAMGVRLSVDDFGAGFASLSLLDRFMFDTVKIDPACLRPLADAGSPPHLLNTILAMARSLGIGVTAEGVETARQAAYLRESRCPEGQGFWFSKPLDATAAGDLISRAEAPCGLN